jgi:uncharacterized membrane protein HdeD (DUF308 family)
MDDLDAKDFEVTEKRLVDAMARNWWLFLVRGITAVIFSILAVIWPGVTILVLTLFWGAYAFVDGSVALWAGIAGNGKSRGDRWWLIVLGVIGILAGLLALVSPGYVATVLLLLIAVWAIVIGIFQIVGAIRLRREIEGEWLLGLGGVLLVLYGVLLIAQPVAGALSVIWMISFGSFVFGVLTIMLALKLRSQRRKDVQDT